MNGRLYDPLLRRFLNADENIQDPTNTQNYNKYGYVMNNPMMYNDPDGEFLLWAAGALIGGYLSGVQANGSWNPFKWDWKNNWGAVVGGAIGGAAISGAIGNIASNSGAIKAVLPGIVSGGLNSAFNGASFLGGAIGGITYTGNIFDNKITSTNMNDTQYARLNQVSNSEAATIIDKNILAEFLVKNGIMPYNPATTKSLEKIISLFSSPEQWVKVGDTSTISDFSMGYLKYSLNSKTQMLELFINGKLEDVVWGVTNPINGKILLSPRLIDGIEENIWAASIVIHEQNHFSNFKAGLYQGNKYINQELNELSAYSAAAKWTGVMEKRGFIHFQNVMTYFLNLVNH